MEGLFAIVLTQDAPKLLLDWAVMDGDPPYLHCNLLEESICGLVRLRVVQKETDQQPATLLVPMRYVAFVMDGTVPKPVGFVPAIA